MNGGTIATVAFMCVLAMSGCNGATVTQPQDVVFPDSNVRFRGQVLPFLTVTCANGGCHNEISAAGGIRLTSYTALISDRPNLVVPGRPDESTVIQVLEGKLGHPVGDLPQRVSSAQVQGMRRWVTEGALNN
ncbi:MAG TPA: c-type cytochrome domain-containing protein [Candidatus Didemnitutus sp.]|nr:c-type cytochrome domain-containing protein [Candidatus Didemnitutus sp.]